MSFLVSRFTVSRPVASSCGHLPVAPSWPWTLQPAHSSRPACKQRGQHCPCHRMGLRPEPSIQPKCVLTARRQLHVTSSFGPSVTKVAGLWEAFGPKAVALRALPSREVVGKNEMDEFQKYPPKQHNFFNISGAPRLQIPYNFGI